MCEQLDKRGRFGFQNNMSMDGKEDYSDLPPNQKKKKLQAKVHELSKQVRRFYHYFFV